MGSTTHHRPFTAVAHDGTGSSPTHLGSQYAALLVEPGFVTPNTAGTLPAVGGNVIASAKVTPGSGPLAAPAKLVRFSNYDWAIRQIGSDRNARHTTMTLQT